MGQAFDSYAKLLHHFYLNGGSIKSHTEFSLYSARQLLKDAVIFKERENYRAALKIYLHLKKDMVASRDVMFEVFQLWSKFFRPITDDVIICSAFEIHLKANLLKKSYLVHRITSPRDLATRQKKNPIHKRTIQAIERKGTPVSISEHTLSITELTSKGYKKKLKLSTAVRKGFEESKRRRNMVHFTEPYAYSPSENLMKFVDYLDEVTKTK